MNFTKGTGSGSQQDKASACKVSYILENDQPVLCTYIGIDPFFYGVNEVDEYLDEGMDDLTGDVFTLEKSDIEAQLDSIAQQESAALSPSEQQKLDLIKQTADFCTNQHSKYSLTNTDITLFTDRLYKSGSAKLMMDDIAARGVCFEVNSQVQDVIYDRQAKKIFVHPVLHEDYAILLMARELRRAWQHAQGVLIHPVTFQPDDAIIINRVQAADLVISQIRIAWELQLAEDTGVWGEIMKSSARDMAHSFKREAKRDFRNLNNGWASQVAFEKWFLTDRARIEDKNLIQMMLADHQGYVFEDTEISRMATLDLVAGLGRMPIGKNYLSGMSQAILNDPMYCEIRDRSNANFLWFIKFEQSFRETERDLQSSDLSGNSAAALDSKDTQDDAQKTRTVLEFPGTARKKDTKTSGKERGSVIDISGRRTSN